MVPWGTHPILETWCLDGQTGSSWSQRCLGRYRRRSRRKPRGGRAGAGRLWLLKVGDANCLGVAGGRHFFSGRSLSPCLSPVCRQRGLVRVSQLLTGGCGLRLPPGLVRPAARRSCPGAPAVPRRGVSPHCTPMSPAAFLACRSGGDGPGSPQAEGSFSTLPVTGHRRIPTQKTSF